MQRPVVNFTQLVFMLSPAISRHASMSQWSGNAR
jgi:hypothetical protein